jgi:hypothetical protein
MTAAGRSSFGPARVEFITLKGGVIVSRTALQLALDLEVRGIPLTTNADHQFIVPTDDRLTVADLAAVRRWEKHLAAIVDYRAPEM